MDMSIKMANYIGWGMVMLMTVPFLIISIMQPQFKFKGGVWVVILPPLLFGWIYLAMSLVGKGKIKMHRIGVKITDLEEQANLPTADEMLIPVYKQIGGVPFSPIYKTTIASLAEIICKTVLSGKQVEMIKTEKGILFREVK